MTLPDNAIPEATNAMSTHRDSWAFPEGAPISAELTALRLLGGGSTYEAYLAFDEVTYSIVVAKVVRPSQVDDSSSLRGLRREIALLGRANHPVVVRGLRGEPDGHRPLVVLEHIEGPRLSSLIRRFGPLQEQQYLPLAIDIAAALHYFRHLDLVHLDIKPSNVIMGSPARLIDLSVARTTEEAASLTTVIGTDAYLSPEQADPRGRGGAGVASDVWGLGATLFEAVAGFRPFDLEDTDSDDTRRTGDPAAYPQLRLPPHSLSPQAPAEVVEVIMGSLAQDPGDRPTPQEVVEALQPVLERQPPARLITKVRG